MTKKDYILIAKIVLEGMELAPYAGDSSPHDKTIYRSALWRFANNFAMQAYLDNNRFDKNRFLIACGFQGN